MKPIQLSSILLAIILILNLIFLAFGKINPLAFWIILIIIGLVAYKVMPKIKNY